MVDQLEYGATIRALAARILTARGIIARPVEQTGDLEWPLPGICGDDGLIWAEQVQALWEALEATYERDAPRIKSGEVISATEFACMSEKRRAQWDFDRVADAYEMAVALTATEAALAELGLGKEVTV